MNPMLALFIFWSVAFKGTKDSANVWNLHSTEPKTTRNGEQVPSAIPAGQTQACIA